MPRTALLGLVFALTVAAHGQTGPDAAPAGPQDAAQAARLAADPWSDPEIAAPRMEARPLERRPAGTRAGGGAPQTADGASWTRSTLALAGVVALILLLAWGHRKVSAGGGTLGRALRGRHAGLIELVSRTALSPRHSVCLVRVGPRLVLVGCAPESVRTLDVINDPELAARLLGEAAQRRGDSSTAEFERCLNSAAQPYEELAPAGAAGATEELAPSDARLTDVRSKLSGTLERLRLRAASVAGTQ